LSGAQPLRTARNLLLLLAAWELLGQFDLVAGGALPAPSEIAVRFWADRGDYAPHVAATLQAAGLGFLLGNAVAIAAALLFVRWPVSERIARGLNVALFALPPIAVVPVLVIAFSGMTPRILLAALAVYFPTMTAMMVGLGQIDPRLPDVVRAWGGGPGKLLRLVRLRSSLPALLAGLRVAAPNAVLGAILAEFGGGGRWGLGIYLLGSLGRADPARLWGIGLTATLIAGLAYALFALLAARLIGTTRAVTLAAGAVPARTKAHGWENVLVGAAALVLPFLLWWAVLAAIGLSPIVARTPWGVVEYLFLSPASANAQARLLAALAQTLPITLVGMAAGLLVAFLLAILGEVRPALARTLLPVALVTQTMPLVALTPLLVLLLGRGTAVIVAITVSVTFFPAYVTLAQGLALVPRAAFDLVRAYGASWHAELRLVAVPSALPYLFTAARLAVPRALLGVMIAEWLATGTGLGNLLNQSRGYLDYGMIWAVALVSVLVSVLFYQLVSLLEARVLGRYGMRAA
jgi:ABC-type nitrate/sulfonate/bicarbonate transport system permease component